MTWVVQAGQLHNEMGVDGDRWNLVAFQLHDDGHGEIAELCTCQHESPGQALECSIGNAIKTELTGDVIVAKPVEGQAQAFMVNGMLLHSFTGETFDHMAGLIKRGMELTRTSGFGQNTELRGLFVQLARCLEMEIIG